MPGIDDGRGAEGDVTALTGEDSGWRGEWAAAGLGLLALGLAGLPIAVFLLAADDGLRGAWTFADAKNWVGLRRFCLASTLAIVPALVLVKLARDRARRWPARLIAAVALTVALPLIPGVVMQAAWWMAG